MTLIADKAKALDLYDRDGYVLFPQVIDQELVGEIQDHVAWLMNRYPDTRCSRTS